jgi:leucyl aminopeptidase
VGITFSAVDTPADRVTADMLAVPIVKTTRGKGRALGPGAAAVDDALGGGLDAFMDEMGFEANLGDTLAVPTSGRLSAKAAVLVGVGELDKLTLDDLRRAGAAIARRSSKAASLATTLASVAPSLPHAEAAQAVVEGIALGAYQFLEYKRDPKPTTLTSAALVGDDSTSTRNAIARGSTIADAVTWARNQVNQPAEAKPPSEMADEARRLLRGRGVTVEVLDVPQLERQKLGGVLGVGRGSDQTPRFLKLTYAPSGARGRPLAFVGKGVVFDSGGLSLKTGAGMETMKCDMSGAAAVIGAMSALQALGIKTRVTGYVPLVENMPSGNAIRPGDVLRIRNGKTVEVLNTDAEGRLILADALSLASEDKVAAAVDVATLTGACVTALGEKIAGLMGNDEAWLDQVKAAADRAGERVWPLPLPADYRRGIDSPVADMKNVGPREGGTLTAGLFLQEFVDGVPWAHLDIAGPAFIGDEDGYMPRGGTGFGVRTLLELAGSFRAPAARPAGRKATAKKATRKAAAKKTARTSTRKAAAKKTARTSTRKAAAKKTAARKSATKTAKRSAKKTTRKASRTRSRR